ncbi:hypothetical protein HAT2_00361 [Candidatus Similichlamydia laticola]|uniref:Uncharacterized protein n=1 Tax=Candidatus Similichlamydia laticola TaxID=2170265 RepID=A0A369KCC1_9BACT|nr:hypothetical protein HAT2_00361 [Candidatus Similichlamydia laticola]
MFDLFVMWKEKKHPKVDQKQNLSSDFIVKSLQDIPERPFL